MPRPLHDMKQPSLGPSAGDLGREAYATNRKDQPGRDDTHQGDQAGTSPIWQSTEAESAPPGQRRKHAQEVEIGRDPKSDR